MILYNKVLNKFLLLGLLLFLLISCITPDIPLESNHSPLLETASESEHYATIQSVLNQEVEAKQTNNQAALQALLDPTADAKWLERQTEIIYPDSNLVSIEAKRIEIVDEWAIVAVVIVETPMEGSNIYFELYTFRILRNIGNGEWKLTHAVPEVWGEELVFTNDCLRIIYYAFDEPYLEAVIPKLEPIYEQITKDFQIDFCKDTQLTLAITPLGSSAIDAYPTEALVPSPSTVGFSFDFADSPEQFLLSIITDYMGHLIVDHAYDNVEMGHKQLAHIAIQWEVEDVTKRSFRQWRYEQFTQSQKQPTLAMLLDPSLDARSGISSTQRNLVGDFMAETYGRAVFASFLKAVPISNSPDELARTAFGQSIDELDIIWQEWLEQDNWDSKYPVN